MLIQSSVVLTTPSKGSQYVQSFPKGHGHKDVYSTNILESLLRIGITPHIIVPRPFGPEDRWWCPLVPANHIFQCGDKNLSPVQRSETAIRDMCHANGITLKTSELFGQARKVEKRIIHRTSYSRPVLLKPLLDELTTHGFLSLNEIELILRQSAP